MTSHHRRLFLVAAAAITTDLASKAAAVQWLNDPIDLGIITVRATKNSGIAFGIGADQPFASVAALTGMVVAAIAVAAWRGPLGGPIGAGLLVGGGTANLANRIVKGSVVELFDLGWWPVFNLADVALTVGVALTMVSAWREDSATKAGQTAESDDDWTPKLSRRQSQLVRQVCEGPSPAETLAPQDAGTDGSGGRSVGPPPAVGRLDLEARERLRC